LTETSEEAAFLGIVEDIAVLARKLAKKEPFKSASGPEALLALGALYNTISQSNTLPAPAEVTTVRI
jgi:hypothetical protein